MLFGPVTTTFPVEKSVAIECGLENFITTAGISSGLYVASGSISASSDKSNDDEIVKETTMFSTET